MNNSFNQKIGFDFSKNRRDADTIIANGSLQEKLNETEITIQDAVKQLMETGLFEDIYGVIGSGKEATVIYGKMKARSKLVCAKVFRYYTSTNVKRIQGSHHLFASDMAKIAAKQEYWNLFEMRKFKIPVPNPIKLVDNIVLMDLITLSNDSYEPAPLLRSTPEQLIDDPREIIYEAIQILVNLFVRAQFIHGDYNDHNLLFTEQGLITMDVSQSVQYNSNTFTDTPIRIRIDKAAKIFRSDLENLKANFMQKFRMKIDADTIYDNTINELPENIQQYLHQDQKIHKYRNYVPELYILKENYRQNNVRKRGRKYQQKKR